MMCRSIRTAVAVTLLALVSAPAFAGGPGSTGSIPVRMKNVGSQSVGVNARSGVVAEANMQSGGRVLAANGVAQFNVKPGTFTAGAANPGNIAGVNKVRQFETRTFKTIYLQAQQDGKTATLVGAPAGVKF